MSNIINIPNPNKSEAVKLLIELPKEFEEHFAMDKFKDSFMRICGDIKEVVLSHSKPGPSLGLSGNYEKELVDVLANAFENAVDLAKLDRFELREPTPEEIEMIKNSKFCITKGGIVLVEPKR